MVQTSVHACARVTAFFELFLGLQSACAAQLAFVYELVLGATRASEDGQRCERSARSSLPLPRSFPAAGRRLRRRVFFFLYRHRASGQRPRRELSKSFRLPSAPSFPLPDPSRPPAGACGAGFFSFFTGNTSKKSPEKAVRPQCCRVGVLTRVDVCWLRVGGDSFSANGQNGQGQQSKGRRSIRRENLVREAERCQPQLPR